MAKKRHQRNARGANASANGAHADGSAAEAGARPVLAVTASTLTAHEALQPILERLDAIAQEAHAYTQKEKAAAAALAEAPPASPPATAPTHKRPREDEAQEGSSDPAVLAYNAAVATSTRLDVFAVMSAMHYQSLRNAVAAYGLQLLPSLEDILKRVTLAVLTPALSTPQAWETLAVLATTFRAGAAHAVTEVLESLLRESGVLLLDAPQLVPAWYAETFIHVLPSGAAANSATAALGGLLTFGEDQSMRETRSNSSNSEGSASPSLRQFARLCTERIARKLRALTDMLYAAGCYVPSSTLQQFAQRHASEVVEGGLLSCYVSASESGEEATAAAAAATVSASAGGVSPSSADGAPLLLLRWQVPAAWHAVIIQLHEAFLFVIRPAVPASLLLTTSRVLEVVTGRLHRGVPVLSGAAAEPSASEGGTESKTSESGSSNPPAPLSAAHAVKAAVVRLAHTVQLLRHPAVLPPLQPVQLTMEKAKRRVFVVEPATTAAPASTVDQDGIGVSNDEGALAVTASAVTTLPPSSPQSVAAVMPTAPAPAPAAAPPAETVVAPAAAQAPPPVEQQQQQQPAAPPTPLPTRPAPSPPSPSRPQSRAAQPAAPATAQPAEEDEDDDFPDIVMED